MDIRIIKADYNNATHGEQIIELLSEYALDPMGGSEDLPDYTKQNLIRSLQMLPHAFSILVYVNGQPAGLVNCFEAFSTFTCRPLINVHDVMVLSNYRGLGLSHKMLNHVEAIAKEKRCGKLTLEVLSGNDTAKQSYSKFGFEPYELDQIMGKAEFWQKYIV